MREILTHLALLVGQYGFLNDMEAETQYIGTVNGTAEGSNDKLRSTAPTLQYLHRKALGFEILSTLSAVAHGE